MTDATMESFQVWTYGHDGNWPGTNANLIISGNVERSTPHPVTGSVWDYGTPMLWPGMGKAVSSFAYAPADAADVLSSVVDNVPEISYTIPTDVNNQVDLLFATTFDRTGPNPIPMTFRHALSQIRLQAVKGAGMSQGVFVESVTFHDLYSTGTASIGEPIGWNTDGPTANYPFEFDSATPLSSTATPIVPDGGAIFLMPQTNEITISVKYSVDGGTSQSWQSDPISIDWAPGNVYTYTLNIGDNRVVFDQDETYTIDKPGYYYIEAWGGDGGSSYGSDNGGEGGYKAGLFYFEQDDLPIDLEIVIGGKGGDGTNDQFAAPDGGGSSAIGKGGNGGNGGGNGSNSQPDHYGLSGAGGGGASGIMDETNNVWLAAGGGGGGGGLPNLSNTYWAWEPNNGGAADSGSYGPTSEGDDGIAGQAAATNGNSARWAGGGGGGGGGGYLGGTGGTQGERGGDNPGEGNLSGNMRGGGGAGGQSWAGGPHNIADPGNITPSVPDSNSGNGYVIIRYYEQLP